MLLETISRSSTCENRCPALTDQSVDIHAHPIDPYCRFRFMLPTRAPGSPVKHLVGIRTLWSVLPPVAILWRIVKDIRILWCMRSISEIWIVSPGLERNVVVWSGMHISSDISIVPLVHTLDGPPFVAPAAHVVVAVAIAIVLLSEERGFVPSWLTIHCDADHRVIVSFQRLW